jgi:hypothetical protein
MRAKYGITVSDRDRLFEGQGGVCAICETDTPDERGWVVDHCHTSKSVRGILCHHCNVMLGMARDNPATLAAAISYLGK